MAWHLTTLCHEVQTHRHDAAEQASRSTHQQAQAPLEPLRQHRSLAARAFDRGIAGQLDDLQGCGTSVDDIERPAAQHGLFRSGLLTVRQGCGSEPR